MRGLEKEYAGRITFVRVNVLLDESLPLMEQYGFSTTPEFILVDDTNQILAVWDDTLTAGSMRAVFDAVLSAP